MKTQPNEGSFEREFLLHATASTAGALLSKSVFVIPQFQREYSWGVDQVAEFWNDLSQHVENSSYFLGLIILTDEGGEKHVVDGQQRLITLSLLATAIIQEAKRTGRAALADRLTADFLKSIDFDSDAIKPRVTLTDKNDNQFFQQILDATQSDTAYARLDREENRFSSSYSFLSEKLKEDLQNDPFKRLGRWSDFLTNRLHFAVFVHPDSASAYQVFEVINTRGIELTTADLLKNYVLSQTASQEKQFRYREWQDLSRQFSPDGSNTLVQFIRHSVTVRCGHVLPKDLFAFLARRKEFSKSPPTPTELMAQLKSDSPIYAQMIDPKLPGPASTDALRVFESLNSIGVIAGRPILLALSEVTEDPEPLRRLLRLVVRRIVVGNLGTGNVERRLGETAKAIFESGDPNRLMTDLRDLNPPKTEFIEQLKKRSFNKTVLAFLRRSILENTVTPSSGGTLHFVWTRYAERIEQRNEDAIAEWQSTIGNTFLATTTKRPRSTYNWSEFRSHFFQFAANGEFLEEMGAVDVWDQTIIQELGAQLAQRAGEIWYADELDT